MKADFTDKVYGLLFGPTRMPVGHTRLVRLVFGVAAIFSYIPIVYYARHPLTVALLCLLQPVYNIGLDFFQEKARARSGWLLVITSIRFCISFIQYIAIAWFSQDPHSFWLILLAQVMGTYLGLRTTLLPTLYGILFWGLHWYLIYAFDLATGHLVVDFFQFLFVASVMALIARHYHIENARALEANRLKSSFVANISHEIRTPLHGILGLAEILEQGKVTADQRNLLRAMNEAGQSLLQLVNDVLDFSKLESGAPVLQEEQFEIRTEIEKLIYFFQQDVNANQLHIFAHCTSAWRFAFGDIRRIRQILYNLIGNAIKYTLKGFLLIEVHDHEQGLRIAVIDSGPGIPESKQAKIFDPFYQVENVRTRQHGGTGLGLSISMRLAELLQSRLEYASPPAGGSCFSLILPLQVSEPLTAEPALELRKPVYVATEFPATTEILRSLIGEPDAARLRHRDAQLPEAACEPAIRIIVDCLQNQDEQELSDWLQQVDALGIQIEILGWVTRGNPNPQWLSGLNGTRNNSFGYPVSCLEWRAALSEQTVTTTSGLGLREAEHSQSPDWSVQCILIVEDNLVNQMLLKRMLLETGCKTDVAVNGLEATQACEHQRYDIILMDIHMPVMDGLEATKQIRSQSTTLGKPFIIAISADSLTETRKLGHDLGLDDYLIKPVNKQSLFQALQRFITTPTAEDRDSQQP
ncbi:MAG: response regulator [Leptospiraceae bacterium]|nr:response regulator [Leptospiraceae bacterium]